MSMIRAYSGKGYEVYIIPIQNEENIKLFSHVRSAVWVYSKDAKKHGKIPAMVLPQLTAIWSEEIVKKAGYVKHWLVFKDLSNDKYYFGNHASFSNSICSDDRQRASEMIEVNIEQLKKM